MTFVHKIMGVAYLSSAYLIPVEYYTELLEYGRIYAEQHDYYTKQAYRNCYTIVGPDGELVLSIPVVKPDTLKCPMKDMCISNHDNWRHLHWNAIGLACNSTPHLEYYKDDFRPFYEKEYEFLADSNEESCQLVCKLIDIQPYTEQISKYKTEFTTEEADSRETIHPKKDFRIAGPESIPHPYHQVFDSKLGFLPNLSIIDLPFSMGPENLLVLTSK